jgi:hypothetical protein
VTPQKQLDTFMAKYTPELAKTAKAMLRKMRKRLPGAVEIVYDNWNGLVIGFGPTEKPSEAILSLLLLPEHVTLCFLNGAALRDPDKLLRGSGTQVRHIRLDDPDHLEQSDVDALIEQAIKKSAKPIAGPSRLIIKSISAKQRPRRPKSS